MKRFNAFCVATIVVFGLSASSFAAHVLTFDDLPSPGSGAFYIPHGYHGFNWTDFGYLNGVNYGSNPSGYGAGVVSPNNVAFNGGGGLALMGNPSGPFNFHGAYLTAAWNDGLSVRVRGLVNGFAVYNTVVNPSPTAPTYFAFNYLNIEELVFTSFGGTNYYGSGSGTHFVMDNFTYSMVPEPSTSILVLLASGLMFTRRYRR